MSTSIWNIFHRPTLGLVVGSLAIIYSIPAFFYSVNLKGGESLIALLYIYLFVAGIVTLIIDRIIIGNFKNLLTVNILEALILTLIPTLISIKFKYDSKKAIVNIVNNTNNYTIIVKDSTGLSIDKFTRKGLFDRQINLADNSGVIYLNNKNLSGYTIEYQGLGVSQTIHGGRKPVYNYNWEFIYDNSQYNYSETKIDSLVQASLSPGESLRNSNFHGF